MSNVALGKGVLISKFAQARKQQTLQPGPNYATLIWHHPALSLQVTITTIFSLHEHVAEKILKYWSGHDLSNRTGSNG